MRLLITRPKPDADRLAARLAALGHKSWLSPVMKVVCRKVTMPDAQKIAGIIITSRNTLRCLERYNRLADFTSLPLFAVGKTSAKAARRRGFQHVYQAAGRAETLPSLITEQLQAQNSAPLYHPGGKKKAFNLAPELKKNGFDLVEQIVYDTQQITRLAPAVIKALKTSSIDGVLLLSPRSARLFANLVRVNKLEHCLENLSCLCLSQNVASAVEDVNWQKKLIAAHPDIDNLLDLIDQIELS